MLEDIERKFEPKKSFQKRGDRNELKKENPYKKEYIPKTEVGKKIAQGIYKTISEVVETENFYEPPALEHLKEKLICKVVSTSRISHTLKSGKIYAFRVVTLVGNGKGLIGVGVDKSISKAHAIQKSTNKAIKNLLSLNSIGFSKDETGVYTSYRPITISSKKYGATTVTVAPLNGDSITSSKNGRLYCELSGLTNILIYTGSKKRIRKGKVGSAMNYFKALHSAIEQQLKGKQVY